MITLQDIKKYEDYVIKLRREFHMYPETGFEEFRTSKRVKEELEAMGFSVTTGIGVTGLYGVLVGNKDGKTIGLRADMDALNMQEENDVEYKSTIDGKMHACGHDTHTAMLLGAAKYFSDHKNQLNGTLKVFFQSAEEGPLPGGGIEMANSGALDDCDAVFGQHITTRDKLGTIVVKKGPAMASPDEFRITVNGFGTHASAPHTGVDPIMISSHLIQAFQTIVSRNVSPTDSAVISVSTIHGGSTFNVIPDSVKMTGTIRTLKDTTRDLIHSKMKTICKTHEEIHNCTIDLDILKGYPAVINDLDMSDFVIGIGQELFGKENVIIPDEPSMGAEDFAYYLQKKPGCFSWLGSGHHSDDPYNHNPKFNPDETAFLNGMLLHVNIVKEFLK